MRINYLGTATAVAIVGVWEALVRTGVLTFDYLPAPSSILASVGELVTDDDLGGRILHTAWVALVAWVIALGVAFVVGVAVALSPRTWRYSMASIEVLRTIPAVALVPVALLVFGPTRDAEIVVAVYAGCWPLLISVSAGVQATPGRLLEVARQMRLSRSRVVVSLRIPAAAPLILSGARLALAVCLVVCVLAEMLGNPEGLGAGIVERQIALQPEQMWVYVIAVAVLGTVLNATLLAGSRIAFPRILTRPV
ncbi:ABC transporter permease [Cryptosporangium sp. NPDC048952]|uniref:ABC transporter permease n=1 Tax=Cryptosporangium sp. NPDC048952 TaxID=3363961 RepID=UPI003719FD11